MVSLACKDIKRELANSYLVTGWRSLSIRIQCEFLLRLRNFQQFPRRWWSRSLYYSDNFTKAFLRFSRCFLFLSPWTHSGSGLNVKYKWQNYCKTFYLVVAAILSQFSGVTSVRWSLWSDIYQGTASFCIYLIQAPNKKRIKIVMYRIFFLLHRKQRQTIRISLSSSVNTHCFS